MLFFIHCFEILKTLNGAIYKAKIGKVIYDLANFCVLGRYLLIPQVAASSLPLPQPGVN